MAAGAVAEQVAVELEQVAGDLETVAEVTRRLDAKVIGSFWIGIGIGAGIGFYVGYRYSKKKLRSEIFAEADLEIAQMRELYEQKIMALDAQDKLPVAEIVEELGYTHTAEENTRVEYANLDEPGEPPDVRLIRPPVPVSTPQVTRSMREKKDENDDWDWETEIDSRDPQVPFIIHQSEYNLNESGYSQTSYIYYLTDDILVDENDLQTILQNRENLIGDEALARFGHGSDDENTVYVRNSELELEFEIHRLDASWTEDVLGQNPNETG